MRRRSIPLPKKLSSTQLALAEPEHAEALVRGLSGPGTPVFIGKRAAQNPQTKTKEKKEDRLQTAGQSRGEAWR